MRKNLNKIILITIEHSVYHLLEKYAAKKNISIHEYLREIILNQLEDEEDIEAATIAYAEYLANPITYTHEEVRKMLGIDSENHREE